jgi:hypothetical protein
LLRKYTKVSNELILIKTGDNNGIKHWNSKRKTCRN